MNELKIFEHPKFGKVRTIAEDGKTLFCGLDAAKALGYAKPQNAITAHCRYPLKRGVWVRTGTKTDGTPAMRETDMIFITDGDLCRLAAKSELPGAAEFESWIFDEVIPSILHTGSYGLPVHSYPPKATSVGEVAQLLKVLRATMKENGQPPEKVSQMVEGVCDQFNICLPSGFVRTNSFPQLAISGMWLTI